MSSKGTPNFKPDEGWQMEPIWLPAPEAVAGRVAEIARRGYQNSTLFEHVAWSLFRVIAGFVLGALVGIPLGYAMGLNGWFRGWFDPIVEFMRPVPPLALIPLVIIWAGIGELGKIILLFLAALWIMAIAARSGVSGVAISKVHAAYSLGASKYQIMRARHHSELVARAVHRRARRDGRVLGHGGGGGARCGRARGRHDDHGRLEVSAHRHRHHGDHPHRHHRIRHRHPDAGDGALAHPVEGSSLRVRDTPPRSTSALRAFMPGTDAGKPFLTSLPGRTGKQHPDRGAGVPGPGPESLLSDELLCSCLREQSPRAEWYLPPTPRARFSLLALLLPSGSVRRVQAPERVEFTSRSRCLQRSGLAERGVRSASVRRRRRGRVVVQLPWRCWRRPSRSTSNPLRGPLPTRSPLLPFPQPFRRSPTARRFLQPGPPGPPRTPSTGRTSDRGSWERAAPPSP